MKRDGAGGCVIFAIESLLQFEKISTFDLRKI